MSLKCAVGLHQWQNCKCVGCEKMRDKEHDWKKDCERCAKCGKTREDEHDWKADCQSCAKCGKTRANAHKWQGCKCSVCGASRDEGHDWKSDCERCSQCGKTRLNAHNWQDSQCSVCRKSLKVPRGAVAARGTTPEPYTNTGWAKEIVVTNNGLRLEMVFIPAGEFLMGGDQTPGEVAARCVGAEVDTNWLRTTEQPQHRVRISKPFYMGKYQVTQEQWEAVTKGNPSHFRGARNPVDQVSWGDCEKFCSKTDLRLPTEAEWEYACRAGTTSAFNVGDTISTDQAHFNGNFAYGKGSKGTFREGTVEVGSYPPNRWGLHDMHGNVSEWCQDWLGEYPSEEVTDPVLLKFGKERVMRGGSWEFAPWNCRSASRSYFFFEYRDNYGCRVVKSLESPAQR